jgi:uncharacterized protein
VRIYRDALAPSHRITISPILSHRFAELLNLVSKRKNLSPMKLHLHNDATQNTITGHGAGYVSVNGKQIESALLIAPTAIVAPWHATFDALSFDDFAALVAWKPALVVFGSGAQFRFPDVRIMAAFSQAKIGFDVMDTGAACRTYNVLASEGRNVAAALLV